MNIYQAQIIVFGGGATGILTMDSSTQGSFGLCQNGSTSETEN
jgi:hypothetical protein